jgi:hypothetical protein
MVRRVLGRDAGDIGPLQLEENRIAVQDPTRSRGLFSFMCNNWTTKATDETGKVYALEGIASDFQSPTLPVDYPISTWKAYLQTIVFLLQNTGRLDMIAYSGIG